VTVTPAARQGLTGQPAFSWVALVATTVTAVSVSGAAEWLSWSFAPGPAAVVCLGVGAFAVAGLMLWWEGGQRGNAVLIWATGVLFVTDKAFAWPDSPLILAGAWFGWLYLLTLAVVLLRYPTSRLTSGLRIMVWLILVGLLVPRTVVVLGSRRVDLVWPASASDVGERVWWPTLFSNEWVTNLAQQAWLVGSVVGSVAVLVAMRRRLRQARPLTRRELTVLWAALLCLAAMTLARLAVLAWVTPSLGEEEFSAEVQAVTLMVIPLALAAAAARRRGQQVRVAGLVHALEPPVAPSMIQDSLRETLGDPELEIYYQADVGLPPGVQGRPGGEPERGGRFVNERAIPLPGPPRAGRVQLTVTDGGRKPQAIVDLDVGVRDRHPELTSAALAAAALAVANARLQVELRLQLDEVVASRARITQAGLQERRRLERDLHDGVQQRLLAIGAVLGRLSLQPLPQEAEQLIGQARDALREARGELSELARGLHPAVLTQTGLRAAVDSVAERLTITAHVDIPDRRWPPAVEATAYYVICEALTNVVKHAHTDSVEVLVTAQPDHLEVNVTDHGRGGATTLTAGTGLVGIRDRVTALGGHLTIINISDLPTRPATSSRDGPPTPAGLATADGTTILVSLPCV
jgi:signal transduction histidine kinase